MIQNPKAEVFSLFPTALYATNYEGDTTEIVEYFDSCEMNEKDKIIFTRRVLPKSGVFF